MNKSNWLTATTIATLLLSVDSVFAQLKDQFLKGTIFLQNGQNINGLIKDEEIGVMNYNIRYKISNQEKKVIVYDTSTVKAVVLENGERYELIRYKGKYMTESVSVLANVIVKGKASLYQCLYKGDKIFIITNNGISFPLQDDKIEQGSTELTVYDYKILLNSALFDANIPREKIEKASFLEKDFTKLVITYNELLNAENQVIKVKRKPANYIIAYGGGMIKSSEENEVYFQGIYRSYLPRISRSTSMNVGLSYFNYRYKGPNRFGNLKNLNSTLISLPVQFQQNILNKSIRPFAFAGLNLSYVKLLDDKGKSQLDNGLQQNVGVGMLYGAGIEADVIKGILIKGEYHYENFSHLIMLGIGYNFSK